LTQIFNTPNHYILLKQHAAKVKDNAQNDYLELSVQAKMHIIKRCEQNCLHEPKFQSFNEQNAWLNKSQLCSYCICTTSTS